MNIQFLRYCAWTVVLSVSFSGTCALLGNESFPSDSSSTIRSRKVDQGISVRNDGEQLVRDKGKCSSSIDPKKEGEKESCTAGSIDDFLLDLFTYEQRRHGAVALHAFLGFYCFVLTALVCHNYLLPSVDRICTSMNISTDVAGATFLAMASSFPEMFVNVIGTFLTESDLGVGTVVGSAVFDTFATPACGALMALHAIPLEWRILSRDCIVYVISVGTLVIIMWDGVITWYEATILVAVLIIYLVLLFSGKWIAGSCSGRRIGSTAKLSNAYENSSVEGWYKQHHGEHSNVEELERQQNGSNEPGNVGKPEKSKVHEEPESPLVWPKERSMVVKCWFILIWPLKFLMFVTIPDSRRDRWRNWYPVTFIMCVIWIAITSYLVSWMMTVVGDTVGIPDSIMGITFLAAGGNMPEIASIVILARQGDGNMAMSNTLGANILDILLCLGLPWTIKCLVTGRNVEIVSGALSYTVLSIIVCIVVLYAVIAFFDFKLNKKVGLICLALYTIFLVFAILVELHVFFSVPMYD